MPTGWFAWYPADYVMDTLSLSWTEDLAYRRLLDWYYSQERGIPDEERYEVTRASSEGERAAVDKVLRRHFRNEGGVWLNARAEREIGKHRDFRSRMSEAGKRGNERRWSGNRRGIAEGSGSDSLAIAKGSPGNRLASLATATATSTSDVSNETSSDAPRRNPNPSPAADKGLFGGPLLWLLEKGQKEPRARTFLGKLQKTAGEAAALAMVDRAMDKDPIDPIGWLSAALKHHETEQARVERENQAFGNSSPAKPYDGG